MQHSVGHVIRRVIPVTVLIGVMCSTTAFLFGSDEKTSRKRAEGKSVNYIANKTYQEECASCHIGYLPGFLPTRSWSKIMSDLENHFGENASLDEPVNEKIEKYLLANAANTTKASPRSKRLAKLIPADEAPIRITETPFWTRKHYSVKGWVWKREKVGSKAKCDSCHRDASKGIFSEYDVQVPKD